MQILFFPFPAISSVKSLSSYNLWLIALDVRLILNICLIIRMQYIDLASLCQLKHPTARIGQLRGSFRILIRLLCIC